MTNRIALGLAAVIVLGAAADAVFDGGEGLLFLAQKTFDLINWVAFWR
ncbi:hypothetical protein [Paenirhodobacter enshiensis]|uniref:Glyceraldehyde-3-phosphate dehydrogenase n=1 Tax=Paenirhodobacter enshiensis TaxID=1105367 RepID=A0A086XWY0_9RHOB|nr:hypothetical protein [Paenirhodobacter enshiensis]KFI26530.1 glyceraldehyde-3-phosphate dehydrogenase [Paenirhodobacter enshiensis]